MISANESASGQTESSLQGEKICGVLGSSFNPRSRAEGNWKVAPQNVKAV